jgi:integrase
MSAEMPAIENGVHNVYTNTQFSEDLAKTILNFRPMMPKRLWNDAVADFTRSAVTDFAPANPREASIAMSVVARLASWTAEVTCHPLERGIVFDGRQIEGFIARGATNPNAYGKRCLRSRLLRIAAELETFDPARRDAGKQPRAAVFAPYTAAEIVRFRSQGSTRSTELRRHNWMTLLSLGAGCALTTSEIVGLLLQDVEVGSDAIRIHVNGDRARTVVCLAVWEDELRQLLSAPLVGAHVFVKTERPRTPSTYVTRFLDTVAKGAEKFTVERLRSTWIVGYLQSGTDPIALMRALGVKSFSTFERLIPYVTMPADDGLTEMFRQEARK